MLTARSPRPQPAHSGSVPRVSTPPSPARLRLRAGLLLGLGGFVLASPAHRALGGRSPYLRDWMLYRDVGVGLVQARFLRHTADGHTTPIDRFQTLKLPAGAGAPRWLTHISGETGLHRVCSQLCAALGPGADLRVHARIATTTGWAELDHGDHDRCQPQPPHPIRPEATPRRLHD